MEIKQQLRILLEICQKDLEILNKKVELVKLGSSSNEAKDSSVKLKLLIEGLEEKKSEALKKRRALDEKLQTEKANLRKWESRAEKIKGEREYTALISEISSQKRTITGIESEMSELATEVKAAEEKLKKTSGDHDEKVRSAATLFDSVKGSLDKEEKTLTEMEEGRNQLLEQLPKPLQANYHRIHDKRGQIGIAILRQEICQACQRKVPPELYIRVLRGEMIEQCPSCLRILVAAPAQPE